MTLTFIDKLEVDLVSVFKYELSQAHYLCCHVPYKKKLPRKTRKLATSFEDA
jgi:hypothetical protein